MKKALHQRIVAGIGANAFGQAISIAIQISSLPLFLYYWDAHTYGVWIILSAIPSYLSMADVGMVTAAGNKMTMALGKGDDHEANTIFQTAFVFMLCVCSALILIAIPVILLIPSLRAIPGSKFAIFALSCSVICSLFSGLADAIFRASGRYALGTVLANGIRLLEWSGLIIGLMFWGSFGAVAFGGLVARAAGLTAAAFLAAKGEHRIRWGVRLASVSELRLMLKPAALFMLLPLAFALSFQGVTLVVGQLFGAAAVAMFNTYRTLARVAVQGTSIFSHALGPEFSSLYGSKSGEQLLKMFRAASAGGFLFSTATSIALFLISPWILQKWTHGAIAFEPNLMLMMVSYAAVSGMGHISRTLLLSTNRHSALAVCITVLSALLFGLSIVLGEMFGLTGVGVSMLLTESIASLICIWLSHKLLHQKTPNKL